MVRSQRLSSYQNREKGRKNGKETGRKERKKEIDSERVFVLQNRQPKVNCFLKKKQHVKIHYPVILLLRILFKEVIRCAVIYDIRGFL